MKYEIRCAVLTLLFCSLQAKIMRNNALMTKMISHFQQDNNLSSESTREKGERGQGHSYKERRHSPNRLEDEITQEKSNPQTQHIEIKEEQPEKVLNLMQNVLCRNFPSIPCKIIMQDHALSKLIERSIQQIAVKKQEMDHSTQAPREFSPLPTLFPVINSEDLSNFLEVSNTGYFNQQDTLKKIKKKKLIGDKKVKNHWSHENPSKKKLKGSKDTKHGTELFTGRKKMRKFYPHKIKYKDKSFTPGTFRDYRDTNEKGSISAEMSDVGVGRLAAPKNNQLGYKVELSNSPVWRIDYMKHGVPSMNMFDFEDERLRGKLIKTGPNAITNENGLEQSVVRKEVLHPDVYIKKNNFHKKSRTDLINSEIMN